ncbi:hypothetical protein ACVWW5_001142 [Bradyrhizobium sp. LM3.4]
MSLDLDAVDLETPRRDRGVDDAQQALVDLVAMRQHLVEIHGAHHRTDIGHGQHDDRLLQIGDFVARLRGIEYLEEGDAVDRDRGVVLGDHLLLRYRDHLLHHVDLAPDAIEIGHDQIEPGAQRLGVFAEPLDGPVIALRHRFHAGNQRDDDEQNQNNRENVETAHISSKAGKGPFPRCHWSGMRPHRFSGRDSRRHWRDSAQDAGRGNGRDYVFARRS